MRAALKRRISDWLPVVLWLGVLILESSDFGSSQHTGGLLRWVLSHIFGTMTEARFELFHHVLRKTGHFLGYGVLCLLLFRALRDTVSGTMRRWTGMALALTFLVASMDEIHQAFLSSRTGRFQDVLLDTFGAACLQLLVLLALRRRKAGTQRAEHRESGQSVSSIPDSSR